jgi:hypothetical protein
MLLLEAEGKTRKDDVQQLPPSATTPADIASIRTKFLATREESHWRKQENT